MNKPELSIIIISYNTKRITQNCLESILKSLQKTSLSYEVIVVDNGSSDGSIEAIQSSKFKIQNYNSKLKIIQNKENVGFGPANNQAVKEAQGEYILLLNSDVIVLDNSIEKLFNFYKQNENKINFLGGKLFNKDMTLQASAGPFYTLPVLIGYLFLRGDQWGLTRSSPNSLKEVDWISGACILTKKNYFNKIRGFDENIFMYMDEIDLLYRAKKIGYRVFFYPEAHFIHLGSASSQEKAYSILQVERKTTPIIRVFEGLIWFYKKHFSTRSLFFLKILLKLKARVAILIGKLTKSHYLLETYEKALKLVEVA